MWSRRARCGLFGCAGTGIDARVEPPQRPLAVGAMVSVFFFLEHPRPPTTYNKGGSSQACPIDFGESSHLRRGRNLKEAFLRPVSPLLASARPARPYRLPTPPRLSL